MVYKGTVNLQVKPGSHLRSVVSFTAQLRRTPQFRVLQVARNPRSGDIEISMALREPLDLQEILLHTKGVEGVCLVGPPSEPSPSADGPVIDV